LCYLPDKVRVLLVNRFPRKCARVSRSPALAGEIFAKDVTFDSGHLALPRLPPRGATRTRLSGAVYLAACLQAVDLHRFRQVGSVRGRDRDTRAARRAAVTAILHVGLSSRERTLTIDRNSHCKML